MKAAITTILNVIARSILRKYRPAVVMVTGSVGKTSTKDAIAAALSGRYYLRASEKSYNSELGVPLTVIGAPTPWSDPLGWLTVILKGISIVLLPTHYPKLLVLEVGADHPGDLARILSVATPSAVVVTRLPDVPVHVEAYADPAEVREEEFSPAYALPHGAPLIISADDAFTRTLKGGVHASVTYYGYGADAGVRITDAQFNADAPGMRATLRMGDETCEIEAPGVIGTQQLYAPAAAVAVALALGVKVKDALKGLASYEPPPGRARVLSGKHGVTLIDDTYNASPAAVEEALKSLLLVKANRRIAVLGDMLELGRYSSSEHERIGTLVRDYADLLVTVGTRASAMRQTALASGMSELQVLSFENASEAVEPVAELLKDGDVVLVKGSQGMRMERIVERLLEDPRDAASLARQDTEWKKR